MRRSYLSLKIVGVLCVLLVCWGELLAQNSTITGTVYDQMGEAIPGVTVVLKSNGEGTITNLDGKYTLSNVNKDEVLVYSFIGMTKQEVAINGRSVIEVIMQDDIVGMEELIVVGFGSQKKATMTGSVVQIGGDNLLKGKNTSSAALALQGEVPGLTITRSSSRPGNEDLGIKIRGDVSVNGSDPLILLDGLEIPGWQLSTINPNDIETMSVLKDGAAAIYGTKAAAGVILVTTKKGKKGSVKVDYKGDYQLNMAYDYPTCSLTELADLWLEAGRNDMIDYQDTDGEWHTEGFTGKFFTEDEWQAFSDGTMPMAPESYYWGGLDHRFSDNRQYDEIYGTTFSHRHSLAISGGGDNTTYRTSMGYANDRSPMEFVYDGAKRFNIQHNMSYDINDVIKTEFTVGYDNRLIDEPTQGVGESIGNFEAFPSYNEEGNYYNLWDNNVLAKLDEGGRTTTEQEAVRIGGTLKLDMDKYVKGLSFKYKLNITKRSSLKNARKTQYTVYNWDNEIETVSPSLSGTYIDIDETRVFFQNHVVQADYKLTIDKHTFAAMVGTVAEQEQTNEYGLKRSNMADNNLDDIETGDATTWENSGGSNAVGLVSYISRLNYDYNGIFLLEALGRRDGSSRFHEDRRWANFYSASGGVRFSEMGFMKDGFFQNLKLRASYGETGSQTGINQYDYISGISTGSTYFGAQPALYSTSYITSMTSMDRTWERVANSNIAVDYSIFDNRLSGVFEYYHKKNNDMLVSITYPDVLGDEAPKGNHGSFKTNGWEASLNWRDQIGEVKYSIGFAMWNSESEITKMEGANVINNGLNDAFATKAANRNWIEGYPLQSLFVYKTDGIFQNEEEVVAYYNEVGFDDASAQTMKTGTKLPTYRSADKLLPGSVRRVDVSEDGVIDEDDLVYFGDANPHYSYSINLGVEWKNFDLSCFLQGVGQQNILRTGTLAYPFKRWWNNQNNSFLGQTWTPDNTGAELPMIHYNGARKTWNYAAANDVNVIKASYLRAKVISLGYTIPSSVMRKINMGRTRVAISGNDLFVISNIKDGLDPESASEQSSGSVYPFNSSVMFSVEASF